MTKNEIVNDINFRYACCSYGLDWYDFEIYEDTIILKTPKKNVFVLFNQNYHTIDIPTIISNGQIESLNIHDEKNIFPYPFQDLSLSDFYDFADRIKTNSHNHGHSLSIEVNGNKVIDKPDSIYIGLLLYIKFLSEQINDYFKKLYQARILGYDFPNVYQYISYLINNMNECIDDSIKNHYRPLPIDIINHLGQSQDDIIKYELELYDIIDLIFNQKGLKQSKNSKCYSEVNLIEIEPDDLTIVINDLLKLLEVPIEEVHAKQEESYNKNEIDLEKNLSNDKTNKLSKNKKRN